MRDPRPFWHQDKHADRRHFLSARGRIKTALRHWFETQGFTEVETGCLQASPGNEAHLHAFRTEYVPDYGPSVPRYLHTSPEFAMKKLLAAGETRIFSFAPVFRNGERGPLHSPEFTMLEWYRSGEPYTQLMDDCATILQLAATASETTAWSWRGRACHVTGPYIQTTVHQAFTRHAGLDLEATFTDKQPDIIRFAQATRRLGVRVASDDTWSDLFSRVLAECIEPALGLARPEMLCEYPVHEAALARACDHDSRVAERFELYVNGVELANGFGELTDAAEQRRRFEVEMAEKDRVYGRRYPLDEDFLAALDAMPQASGCALGFDRLTMLATGATHIDQVQWTPFT